MFHRRRRSASVTRQNATPSQSAQTAAAQAFLASKPSSANLSASAAAAALRTMSPTPTTISGIQTKRMLQRQSSTGSRGGDGGELQRRNSSGSMTERTFRTPSPNRPGQSSAADDAPPVPPVPKVYNNGQPHRRAVSVEPSMRVVSPTPTRNGGRGASLDRTPGFSQKTIQSQRQMSLPEESELERSESRDSVNFSYPTGARPNSPSAARPLSPMDRSTSGISQQAANNIKSALNQTADQPVKKKKKRIGSRSTEGSHLAVGAMGSKPLGTGINTFSAEADRQIQTPNVVAQKKKSTGETTSRAQAYQETSSYGSDSDSTTEKSTGKRSQRASGILTKQPSVVREDWEGEQADSLPLARKELVRAGIQSRTAGSPSDVCSENEIPATSTTEKIVETAGHPTGEARPTPHLITTTPSATGQQVAESTHGHLEVKEDAARPSRQTSISPSRSTRFSAHLASEFSGRPRHEPLPRSVSPAKSALKHRSPSPQSASPIDGTSATGWKRASQASSETSDNASMASADGLGSRSHKKRSARVNFETDPEVVGTAADATISDTPIVASPQHKDSMKKAWFGRSKAGQLDSIPAEDEMEEVMRPRPVLPSFGSVRGRREGSVERAIPVTEAASPSSSETSSASNLATLDTSISSDHAIGGLFAREASKSQHEGSFDLSRTTKSFTTLRVADSTDQNSRRRPSGTLSSSPGRQGNSPAAPNIPSIAIQPATPGIGEKRSQDEWLVEVPGGFPEAFELEGDSPRNHPEATTSLVNRNVPPSSSASSPADVGIAEPKYSVTVAAENPTMPPVGSFSEALRQQIEPESDSEGGGSSIYSDAAEDLSDLEGDGFGSINAIVESPVVRLPTTLVTTPPDSPLTGRANNENMGATGGNDSWEKAEAHWRSVAERQRISDQGQLSEEAVQNKPRRKKKKREGETIVSASPSKGSNLFHDSAQRGLPQPSAYPAITKDSTLSGQGTIRRSMRDQPLESSNPTGFKSSMRTKQPPEALVRGAPTSNIPKGALQKKKIPSSPAGSSPRDRANAKPSSTFSPSSPLARNRRLSIDSDSSSSFKKARRPASSGGKFTMRSSMRSADERPNSPPALADRGVRSVSPPSRRPFSPMGQGTMRTSMRGSDAGVPSLRKPDQKKPSSTISGFGKARSKAKTGPSKSLASKLKSRVVDSDNDDEVSEPRTFRSRFDDSSDEEPEVVKYRPVRGIPRKPDEGDSTDLEDSSDDGRQRTTKGRRQGLKSPVLAEALSKDGAQESEIGSPRESPAISPADEKKKGLFGRFRSKKVKETTKADVPPSNPEADMQPIQSKANLEEARSPEFPASPDSKGKLQRRHLPHRMTSDSWPLPPKPFADDGRPNTSEGTSGTAAAVAAAGIDQRPGLGSRQNTSGTMRTEGGTPIVGRTGKKKRFPMLRKAFGLHD